MMNIKKYSYKKDKNLKLTEHFKVGECRCKDGSDEILIDINLAKISEEVRKYFNCKKINITSGYRTSTHDKKVGGSGNGYHTKGQGWDISSKDQNGKTIDAKYICCYLEDIGVKGIGYINKNAVHIDTRKNKYWFDETKQNRNVGKSFYEYFNIKKEVIYPSEINEIIKTNNNSQNIIENKKEFKYICKETGYKKIKVYSGETLIIK